MVMLEINIRISVVFGQEHILRGKGPPKCSIKATYHNNTRYLDGHLSHLITKPAKWHMRPAKTQISLGFRPVRSESSQCAQWVAEGPRFLHADSKGSDQTGRMPRLIWVFGGRTVLLLVLSWGGSFLLQTVKVQFRVPWSWRNKLTRVCNNCNSVCIFWTIPAVCSNLTISITISLVTRKPVFGVSDQLRLKPACSADETI